MKNKKQTKNKTSEESLVIGDITLVSERESIGKLIKFTERILKNKSIKQYLQQREIENKKNLVGIG